MLEPLNNLILEVTDFLLGWLLALSSDVALFIPAVGTAAILTGARLFATDQHRLRLHAQDKAQLNTLIRAAGSGEMGFARKGKPATLPIADSPPARDL